MRTGSAWTSRTGEEYTVRLRTKTSLPERLQATQLKILGIKDADGNAIRRDR